MKQIQQLMKFCGRFNIVNGIDSKHIGNITSQFLKTILILNAPAWVSYKWTLVNQSPYSWPEINGPSDFQRLMKTLVIISYLSVVVEAKKFSVHSTYHSLFISATPCFWRSRVLEAHILSSFWLLKSSSENLSSPQDIIRNKKHVPFSWLPEI